MTPQLASIRTPLEHVGEWMTGIDLWVKDESFCPTHTFKDRLAWKYADLLSSNDKESSNTVLASITLGNTMRSFAYAIAKGVAPELRPRLLAIFPLGFSERTIGPDSNSRSSVGSVIIESLVESGVKCVEYPLTSGYLTHRKLNSVAHQLFQPPFRLFNATDGIGVPAYKQIMREAIEEMPMVPDCVLVPVGAGVLFMECVAVIKELGLKTQVHGVAVTRADSIADKIYGLYSPFYSDLLHDGLSMYQGNDQFVVERIVDEQIIRIKDLGLPRGFECAEPSAWAALVPLLSAKGSFNKIGKHVLAINTGNGILCG